MEKVIDKILEGSIDLVFRIILAVLVIVIGSKLIKVLVKKIKNGKLFQKIEKSSQTFISSCLSIVLKIIIFIIAITILGIPTTTIVTIVGSAGLALGLALQGGLSNIAGGLMIMIFKPFKVGDYISANGYEGYVKGITMFYTCLVSLDNKVLQLPNGNLSNSEITNYTMNKLRMLDIRVSVSYDSDIKKVKDVLSKVANNYDLILKDKDINIKLKEMADSSLIFIFRAWVNTKDYWTAFYDINELIKESLDKNKIEIPYPQMDIHMKK